MNDILSWILDTVRNVDPVLRVFIATLGMFFETSILIGLIVPGDTIVLVSATAISGWGEFIALLVGVIVGSLAGETLGFTLGKYFGPRIRASRLGQKLGERNWMRAERYLARRGGIAVFISRFLPVLHALIPITVGMSAMSFRRFMTWTAPACIVWAVAYTSVGWLAAGSYRSLSAQLHYAGYVFAAILIIFVIVVFFVRKALERREARHMEHQDDNTSDGPNDGGTREP